MKSHKIDQGSLEILKKQKKNAVERYHFTIQYLLGIRRELQEKYPEYVFIGTETKILREPSKKPLNPDLMLLKESEMLYGILEIKSSLSDEDSIKRDLKEMERYNDPLTSLPLSAGKKHTECIIFSPEMDSSKRLTSILIKELADGNLVFKKPFLVWEWALKEGIGAEELLVVRQIYGPRDAFGSLSEKCDDTGLRIDLNGDNVLIVEREFVLFTPLPPPREYTAMALENNIFNWWRSKGIKKIKVDDVLTVFDTLWRQPLLQIKGKHHAQQSKIKKEWIEDAFDLLSKAKFLQKEGDHYYFKKKKNVKDFRDKICEISARIDLKKGYSPSQDLTKFTPEEI